MRKTVLAIESSCDDTSAAVVIDGILKSNVIASQRVHESYGGVVPELASRAHQQNIVPVVSEALKTAGVTCSDISAIAYTRGPGLIGSLLVGTSFAKGLSLAMDVPLIEVNHLQAHALCCFIRETEGDNMPDFPYLTLLVSGGNSQIILVEASDKMTILGSTIDDAAGEAFDKCGKVMGLPYPAGPHIDRLAKNGNSSKFHLSKPRIEGLDYSFSGLKTSFLYLIRDAMKENANFIEENRADLAASLQQTIIDILMEKFEKALKLHKPAHISIGGGVSANSAVREAVKNVADKMNIKAWIPPLKYTTDNAAMVAMAGYFKLLKEEYSDLRATPYAKISRTLNN